MFIYIQEKKEEVEEEEKAACCILHHPPAHVKLNIRNYEIMSKSLHVLILHINKQRCGNKINKCVFANLLQVTHIP